MAECSDCHHEIHRDSGTAYCGDHVRHRHRSDCIAAIRAELTAKEEEIARLRESKAAWQERWEAEHNAIYRMRTALEDIMKYTDGYSRSVAENALNPKPKGGPRWIKA